MSEPSSLRIHITGVVQGVGFRPFVYNLATRLGLAGWVLNSSSGVEIEAAGPAAALDEFVRKLSAEAPPLARVERVAVEPIPLPADGFGGAFAIRHSAGRRGEFLPISPDVAICADCRRELFDPADRRYRYPFINCTNCGPRFTIIRDIPYDRPNTTMAPFRMCPDCQAEYDDPANRRFHAQPNACPVCGPQVTFHASRSAISSSSSEQAVQEARSALASGAILAVKGLGGFHLACDATSEAAVAALRERKGRVDKPFALMSFDLEAVRRYCEVGAEEEGLLSSRERPIVLLRPLPGGPIAPGVAPGNPTLGVMLPYAPLHYLLLEPAAGFPIALVMTSGNYAEEPIATDNAEALERLAGLADAFLLHDRDIHARCDDSVTRMVAGVELPIRRSRGYAPYPVHLPHAVRPALAVGGELKNTFCLTRERYAFLSQHIGDMENYETLRFFEQMVAQLERTFRIQPEVVACDMHPNYLSTRFAREQAAAAGLPLVPVQHHHAHIAACLAENGHSGARPVIGVAFDGTGYGVDGAIWGGEFLVADYASCRRAAHLKYVPLPGGDAAIRRPYRVALAHLWAAGLPWEADLPPVQAAAPDEREVLARQLERGLNTVPTSSMGRLFDAVAALAGVRQEVNYEAQAAMELEGAAAAEETGAYAFAIARQEAADAAPDREPRPWVIDPAPVLRAVVADVRAGLPAGRISARLHNGLARLAVETCLRLREETGLEEVALSGGVFQNATLLRKVLPLLQQAGLRAYVHRLVPPNDAGISLGQAVVGANAKQANDKHEIAKTHGRGE